MRIRALLTAALLVASGAPPGASAKASDPIVMRASGGTQRGGLLYFTQSERQGDLCAVLHADGTGEVPEAVPHDGSSVTWRLADRRKPTAVTAYAVRYVLPYVPVSVDGPERLATTLRPVRVRGKVVAWDVRTGNLGDGEAELRLFVTWQGACAEDEAARVFHVRSLPGAP